MNQELPRETKVVVIGGGIVGCSVAYHLALAGWRDVVLLEQNRLGAGTTWHAAGMVGQLRTSNSQTKVNKYSVELYSGLERETGHSVGWKQVGSLIVATCEERMTQLHRTTAMAELFGVECHMLTPDEALEKWPLMRSEDLLGAAWLPGDGKVLPGEVPLALAKGAGSRGARILEGIEVLGLIQRGGRIAGVQTGRGTIHCEYAVICGGMWSRQFGLRHGVSIPLHPVEHHYVVSNPLAGAFDELPCGRDPDHAIYFRGEGNKVLLGAFQKFTKPWKVPAVPGDFAFQLLEPDWDKYRQPLEAGEWRIPGLQSAGYEKFVNGPESFTPDNHFLMGETPELRNLFVAAGFNSAGIACAGGAGKYLAEWMIEGGQTMDFWSVDIRRFSPLSNNRTFLLDRVTETLGLHYQLAWPNREFETGRGLRQSPLHDRLKEKGACFGVKNGWERPNWFARGGMKTETDYSFSRQNWFEQHRLEHLAARESVALFDQTGFSKYLVQGPDALPLLQRLCGANVDVPVGQCVYTGMFNARGTFESDLTVTRTGDEDFYLVSGSAQAVRDVDWIRRNMRDGEMAVVTDSTTAWSVLGVMGPNSRALLSELTGADLSNEGFPFGTVRWMDVGRSRVRAARVTYVGELGWELHVPNDQAVALHQALVKAGDAHGLTLAGHYAINSLRLEKGYRAWGAELSVDETPFEAGLSFAIDWSKTEPFIGRDALMRQKGAPLKKRLLIFTLEDPEPMLWGNEPIYRDGEPAGYTTSGSYGHTLNAAVGMGYVRRQEGVDREYVESGRFEFAVGKDRVPAKAFLRAPYDPERKRILS